MCSTGPSRSACCEGRGFAGLPARTPPRRRCTTLLRCLCGVAILTGLIGMWPGMHLAWIFTGLAGVAAVGLVGLMAYAKELEAEQQRRRSTHEEVAGPTPRIRRPPTLRRPAYPGAWDDDDFEEPRFAVR